MWKHPSPTLGIFKYKDSPMQTSQNIIMFDLDWTLVRPLGKRKFSKTNSDWQFIFAADQKLRELDAKLYIITNQAMKPKKDFHPETRITNIVKALDIPIIVFASRAKDIWRKPNSTIFEKHILSDLPKKKSISILYVGDAAGRESDFADSDRKFAYNIHLLLAHLGTDATVSFQTPEEFFLGGPTLGNPPWRDFDPQAYLDKMKGVPKIDYSTFASNVQDLVVMVGFPASGKSTFARGLAVHGYEIVNQDELGTFQKVIRVAREHLQAGKSIIIDSTNRSIEKRANYIRLAKSFKTPVKCIWITTPIEIAQHMNIVRERMGGPRIPQVAYNVYRKRFQPPTKDEGFTSVKKVSLRPEFSNKRELLMFLQKS